MDRNLTMWSCLVTLLSVADKLKVGDSTNSAEIERIFFSFLTGQVSSLYPSNNILGVQKVRLPFWFLKGHRHDWGKCLFTKIIWHEILIEFLQKVIQKCTNHFGKDWAINRAEITHKVFICKHWHEPSMFINIE